MAPSKHSIGAVTIEEWRAGVAQSLRPAGPDVEDTVSKLLNLVDQFHTDEPGVAPSILRRQRDAQAAALRKAETTIEELIASWPHGVAATMVRVRSTTQRLVKPLSEREHMPSLKPSSEALQAVREIIVGFLSEMTAELEADSVDPLLLELVRGDERRKRKALVARVMIIWRELNGEPIASMPIGNADAPAAVLRLLIDVCTPIHGRPVLQAASGSSLRRDAERVSRFAQVYGEHRVELIAQPLEDISSV